jgi:hypothetical protein
MFQDRESTVKSALSFRSHGKWGPGKQDKRIMNGKKWLPLLPKSRKPSNYDKFSE